MPGPFESGPDRVGQAPFTESQGTPPLRSRAGIMRVLSVPPWDQQPIPTATNFFRQQAANLSLPAAAGATVVTTLPSGALQVPRQNIVSLQAVSLFCDSPTLTTSILYTVRANGSPIPGLTGLSFPPQTAAFINFPIAGPFNVLSPGAFIDVLITRVVADVVKLVNFTFLGWFNSPQDVARWTGEAPGQIG